MPQRREATGAGARTTSSPSRPSRAGARTARRYATPRPASVTASPAAQRFVALLLLVIGASIGIAAYWGAAPERWAGYVALVPAWAAGTLGIQVLVPMARTPKVWGVPMLPWLPSLSIATNLFLMGSLGKDAFVRFGVCTALMLLYYVLVGLHATYDVAHGKDEGDVVVAAAGKEEKLDVEKDGAADKIMDGNRLCFRSRRCPLLPAAPPPPPPAPRQPTCSSYVPISPAPSRIYLEHSFMIGIATVQVQK
ncbi:hypothetical protein PR202_gb27080 [Eleusine coracana subsp. coracana]|uniref:Cationic amino acid transporter C-terminal domain-containing protein n=1 Tax=Eleusine coracana subsp. coracana TaxID=191504 RepID=A0AAV5FUX6_ELECO|nr:hypothetical protein PR202_gb27080 [Eleusine coracana subsp. coracana]